MANNTNDSGQSTEGLVEQIESLLHNNRSALSAEAVHLLEEACDELKRVHSNSRTDEESARTQRDWAHLLRLFAKPEVLDRFGKWIDRMFDGI